MKAVTFQGVGEVKIEDVADPTIVDPTDVVLRITTSAVCGSDLHQYHGRGGGLVEKGAVGICNARNYITPLLPLVEREKLRPARIITHTIPLKDTPHGDAIFDRKEDRATNVMLKP